MTFKENDEFFENDDMSQISSAIDNKSTTNTIRSNATSINTQYSGKLVSTITSSCLKKLIILFNQKRSTGKMRGKKKAISLKKGSLNEDLAIIQELSDLINIVYNMQGEDDALTQTCRVFFSDSNLLFQDSIVSLNRTLVLFLMDDMCLTLQIEYGSILETIEKSLFEIWDNLENKPEDLLQKNRSFMSNQDDKSITDYSKLGRCLFCLSSALFKNHAFFQKKLNIDFHRRWPSRKHHGSCMSKKRLDKIFDVYEKEKNKI
jgi:hypothetical protein